MGTLHVLHKYDSSIGYKFRPNLNIAYHPDKTGIAFHHIKTGPDGFRCCHSIDSFNASTKKRILVIGCSFTAGHGVSNEHRFTDLVEQDSNMILFNAAMPGTGNDQQLLIMKSLLEAGLKPDAILMTAYIGCSNRNQQHERSTYDVLTEGTVSRPKPYFELQQGQLRLYNVPVPHWKSTESPQNTKGFLSRVIARITPRIFTTTYASPNPLGRRLTASIFTKMHRLSKTAGAEFILAPVPSAKDLNPLSHFFSHRFYSKLASQLGCRFFDLHHALAAAQTAGMHSLYIQNDGHFSKRGHQVVAQSLRRLLEQ